MIPRNNVHCGFKGQEAGGTNPSVPAIDWTSSEDFRSSPEAEKQTTDAWKGPVYTRIVHSDWSGNDSDQRALECSSHASMMVHTTKLKAPGTKDQVEKQSSGQFFSDRITLSTGYTGSPTPPPLGDSLQSCLGFLMPQCGDVGNFTGPQCCWNTPAPDPKVYQSLPPPPDCSLLASLWNSRTANC